MALFISCREGRLALRVEDQRFAPLGDLEGQPFVEGLRALMRRLEITPPENIAGLPPITRALYGYLGLRMAGCSTPSWPPSCPRKRRTAC